MSYTQSPNMNLKIPVVGTEPGPDYATDINDSLSTIDSHNHTTGSGAPIPVSALNVDADFNLNNKNLTNAFSVRFLAAPSTLPGSVTSALYVYNNDLYFNNGSGNFVQMTNGTALNVTSTGISSGTANASFIGNVLTVTAAPTVPANIDGGSIVIRNTIASSKGVTLQAPIPLSIDYTLVLPTVPAQQNVMTLDSSGNMSSVTWNTVGINMGSTGADNIGVVMTSTGANAIGQTMTSTGANAILSTGGGAILPSMTTTPSHRNRLINGSMGVDQRNSGAAQTIVDAVSTFTVTGSVAVTGVMTVTASTYAGNNGQFIKPGHRITGGGLPAAGVSVLSQINNSATTNTVPGTLGDYQLDTTTIVGSTTLTVNRNIQYTVDRWYSACTGGNITGRQRAQSAWSGIGISAGTTPSDLGFAYTLTGGAVAATKVVFAQRIEAANSAYLASKNAVFSVYLATTETSPVTVTWQIKRANAADQFGGLDATTKESLYTTTISSGTFTVSSATFARFDTGAVAIPAAGANGLEVVLSVATITNTKLIAITGAQLEQGSTPSTFEARLYGDNLMLCQRYFETGGQYAVGYNTAGSGIGSSIKFSVKKLRAPNFTGTNIANGNSSIIPLYLVSNFASSVDSFLNYRTIGVTGAGDFRETWTADSEL